MAKRKRIRVPTLTECETAISIPCGSWPTRCHEIAVEINRKLDLRWQECYGFYYGPVGKGGPFDAGRPMQRHGWLKLPDGRVFDPTRWVFECVKPYVFCAYDNAGEYDLGMERFKAEARTPPPGDDAHPKKYDFTLADADAAFFVCAFFDKYPELNLMQLAWLANMGPTQLDRYAKPIYEKIVELGQSAFIPIDYQTAVLKGGKY